MVVVIVVAIFAYVKLQPASQSQTVDSSEFAQLIKSNTSAMLVDVREDSEYKSGTIAGAQNIPLSVLSSRLDEFPQDKDTPLLLFCRSGHRSQQAAQLLLAAGYTNVTDLQGGIMAWTGKVIQP